MQEHTGGPVRAPQRFPSGPIPADMPKPVRCRVAAAAGRIRHGGTSGPYAVRGQARGGTISGRPGCSDRRGEPGHGGGRSGRGGADRRGSGMRRRDGSAPRRQCSIDSYEDGMRADRTSAQGAKCAAAAVRLPLQVGEAVPDFRARREVCRSRCRGIGRNRAGVPQGGCRERRPRPARRRRRRSGSAPGSAPQAGHGRRGRLRVCGRPVGSSRHGGPSPGAPGPSRITASCAPRTIDRNLGRKSMAGPIPQPVRMKGEPVWPTDLMSKGGGRYFR